MHGHAARFTAAADEPDSPFGRTPDSPLDDASKIVRSRPNQWGVPGRVRRSLADINLDHMLSEGEANTKNTGARGVAAPLRNSRPNREIVCVRQLSYCALRVLRLLPNTAGMDKGDPLTAEQLEVLQALTRTSKSAGRAVRSRSAA